MCSESRVTSLRGVERAYRVASDPGLRLLVVDLGLACCALEVGAAISSGLLVPEDDPDPATMHVLLVTGTVTDPLAPAVLAAWDRLPEPRAAMSFGACANTGGPYWDAPTVAKGVDQLLPVATYVPGCPPSPQALVDAIGHLAAQGVT